MVFQFFFYFSDNVINVNLRVLTDLLREDFFHQSLMCLKVEGQLY